MTKKPKLLSRDAFREGVFERDGRTCVCCEQPAVDAHHIIERRLWSDGGYYLENGASLCAEHHMLAEQTLLTPEYLREQCGITHVIVPDHLYPDHIYDKWGNPVMEDGRRGKGELFFDESVQKALNAGGVLDLFTDRVKYPRTHHFPWSPGIHSDDRVISSLDNFAGKRVIVTVKQDGENTTLYRDYIHARSLDSRNHPSRDWVKNFHANFAHEIPEGFRICGENLYAEHSIHYDDLESYFMGFSIWTERNECLSWDETLEWFSLLDITPVPVLYDGIYDEKLIRSIEKGLNFERDEGFVLRLADGFKYGDFKISVAKFVRQNHVQTNKHWMQGQRVIPNGLKRKKPKP